MPEVSIHLHATNDVDFATSDAATVASVQSQLGPERSHLVPTRMMAQVLRGANRKLWASRLDEMEEPHMVRVVFSGH